MTPEMEQELLSELKRLQSRVAALERQERPATVMARYSTNAGQSISHNTVTIVDFEDQGVDTHGAVTTGAAWRFTAPATGYYAVIAKVLFTTTTTWALAEIGDLRIYVNGVQQANLSRPTHWDTSGVSNFRSIGGVDVVSLAAAQYVDVRVFQNSGGALALHNSGADNYVCIFKIN